jgi:hypothetical protein
MIRGARMFTFGLFFYGPYQYWWYRTLDRSFRARTVANFAAKVWWAVEVYAQSASGTLPVCLRAGCSCTVLTRLGPGNSIASALHFSGPFGLRSATDPTASLLCMPSLYRLLVCPSLPILQVALNQLCLAPITISVAFAWNLALQRRLDELPAKLRSDFLPTMLNGWKFWVPAATFNFTMVPLQYQVST